MSNQNSKNKTNNKKKENNNRKVNNTVDKNNNKKSTVKNDSLKNEPKKDVIREEVQVSKVADEKNSSVKENTKKCFKLTSRQKDIILVLLVVILLVVAIFVSIEKKPELDIELPTIVEGEPGFNEITYAEYEDKIKEKKPFLVVIVQDGCGYCDMFKPVVEEVSKEYSIPTYYMNLTNLSQEEEAALSSSNSYLKKGNWGTPTTLFIYGDIVIDSLGGYKDKDGFVSFVKENIKVDLDAE